MIRCLVALGVLAGFLWGCGGGSSQLDSYSTALQQTRAAVDAHRASAEAAKEQGPCDTERARYGEEVRPPLSDMRQMSGGGTMQGGMGGRMTQSCPMCRDAQLAEGCTQMDLELNVYLSTSCSADPAANAAEALRHCDRMEALLDDQQQRLQQLGGR